VSDGAEEEVIVRGHRLSELSDRISFAEMMFLLLRGDVTFVAETDDDINDQIDAAYRTKCRRHGGRYVDPMVAPTARATTIKTGTAFEYLVVRPTPRGESHRPAMSEETETVRDIVNRLIRGAARG
jgi:citrate synthase